MLKITERNNFAVWGDVYEFAQLNVALYAWGRTIHGPADTDLFVAKSNCFL